MKKSRKILKTILVIIVLLVVANLIFRFFYHVQFNRRVEELSEQGFPVSLDDLEKAYILPEGVENAADVYLQAFSHYQEPNEFEREYLPIRGNYCWGDNEPPFPEEVMKAIESSLQANQRTLELLDRAAGMEYCLWPRTREDYAFWNDNFTEIKKTAMLLCERNLYLAQNGQPGELMTSFQDLTSLSDGLLQQPFLIDYLVSIAVKAMAIGNLEDVINQIGFTEPQLKHFQEQIFNTPNTDVFYEALINDRCAAIVRYGLPLKKRYEYLTGWPLVRFWPKMTKVYYFLSNTNQKDKLLSLDFYQEFIQTTQLPPDRRQSALEKIKQKMDEYSNFHLYFSELRSLISVYRIDMRVLGNFCCAETALAIERYRLKYNVLPKSLENLVPEFMEAVPLDPFDGEILRYIKHDVGYTVYTIGDDGVDNGGLSREQMEEKTGEKRAKEYDWPFTVRR